ncbi:MAG: PAS domain S-box protein, partial [Deltaproteobacteria bacterium]|nr:PAS domain S-box protein [Deltaproteobacteria bacterium]
MTSPLVSRKVYLIDNSPSLHDLVDALFNEIGETIHSSASGKKALSEIPAIDPDLILCNFQTSDITGRDVFLNLVQQPFDHRLSRAPFILFSDRLTREKLGQELFDLGLEAWFTQPLNVEGLRDVLENLFLSHDTTIRNIELRQEVRRSEYRYRDLLESVNDLVFMLDDEGVFTYLNNRFTPLTGWQKESWIGRPFLDLIVETDRSKAKESIDMVSHGRARLFESIVLSHNQTHPILSFNVSPIFEKTEISGSICIARDVTEQRTMEREILDLKNFNESIIQSMEAGLLTIDLDGFITSVNAGAEKILGWKAEEILDKQIRFVLDPREADFLISNPPPPGSLPYSREGELTIRSGQQIAIGFTTTDRIDNRRQKVGTIISFRDISQLKQMQREVMRMDRLASLGVLASGIAHEIKNPLAGIKTLAQACEEEIEPNDQRREYLMRIVRQVNRLDDLLKTFFAFARPKPPDRQPHHLQEIFQ